MATEQISKDKSRARKRGYLVAFSIGVSLGFVTATLLGMWAVKHFQSEARKTQRNADYHLIATVNLFVESVKAQELGTMYRVACQILDGKIDSDSNGPLQSGTHNDLQQAAIEKLSWLRGNGHCEK